MKKLFIGFMGFFTKGNIGKQTCNQSQGRSNKQFSVKISKINHFLLLLRNLIAIYRNIIPVIPSKINRIIFAISGRSDNKGTPSASPNQPAARLISKSATLASTILSIFSSYHTTLAKYVTFNWFIVQTKQEASN